MSVAAAVQVSGSRRIPLCIRRCTLDALEKQREVILCSNVKHAVSYSNKNNCVVRQNLECTQGHKGKIGAFLAVEEDSHHTRPNSKETNYRRAIPRKIVPPKFNPNRSKSDRPKKDIIPGQSTTAKPALNVVRGLCTSRKRKSSTKHKKPLIETCINVLKVKIGSMMTYTRGG